jgi:spore coat polysaccharide biosynthesis protein SpsF
MRIGFLITARLKSSRLPLKILKDLNGKTVIERVIERAREVQDISEIVLCTSTHPQDKPLVDTARKNDLYYFNGSEEDVLQRLWQAARLFDLDAFVSITADNPLFSIEYSNLIVDTLKQVKSDYIKITGLPLGTAPYGLNSKALETVCSFKSIVNTEIWGYLLDRPDFFDVIEIRAQGKFNRPDLRLTLDYEEDYLLIQQIYQSQSQDQVPALSDIIDFLTINKDIAGLNQHCVQRDLDENIKKLINEEFHRQRDVILKIKKMVYERQ